MNKLLPTIALLVSSVVAFSQARIVINGATAVTIVEHGGTSATPIYIELNNPATNAIMTVGVNNLGWIISEAEFDMIKWDIGTTTGNYQIPWGLGTTYALPFALNITGAGVGAGSILFATYHTDPDNGDGHAPYNLAPNHVYPDITPTGVTNMGAMNTPGSPSNIDNSYDAVDRFWIIDPKAAGFAYGTSPTVGGIKFTYAHSGVSAEYGAPNINPEADLIAQRFNTSLHTWGDWLGSGAWATAGNTASVNNTAGVTNATFFRAWTLSNSINPLPITLSSFTAQCDNGAAFIQWTTQSELNDDFFTVEKTADNIHFEIVQTNVPGAGTTSLPSNYSITDNSPFEGTSYYILFQTDYDGNQTQVGDPIMYTGCGTNAAATTINAYNTTDNIKVQINSTEADNYNISLVNILGQTMFSGMHAVSLGENDMLLPNNLSPGVYILNVKNDKINYAKKMVIGVR